MSDFVVTARHKCGSSILKRILKYAALCIKTGESEYYKKPENSYIIKPNNANDNERTIHFYRNSRQHQAHHESDKYVFILRNPLSICISAYYSFGYTHKRPSNKTEEEFKIYREHILSKGLEGYIDSNIERVSSEIEWFFNSKLEHKTFLPYELMLSDFGRFLYDLLESINCLELYTVLFDRWADEFKPFDDRSHEIERQGLKTHKRTSNINEWKEKITEDKLKEYISNNPGLNQYIKWSDCTLNNKPL